MQPIYCSRSKVIGFKWALLLRILKTARLDSEHSLLGKSLETTWPSPLRVQSICLIWIWVYRYNKQRLLIAWFPCQQSVTSLRTITVQNQVQVQVSERTVPRVLATPDLKELALSLLAFGSSFKIRQSSFQ